MKRFLVLVFLAIGIVSLPKLSYAADARCCIVKESGCYINCKYSCRILIPGAPACNASINEEEADCLTQGWSNINAAQSCAQAITSYVDNAKEQSNSDEHPYQEIQPKLQIPIAPNFQFSNIFKKDEEVGDGSITYLYVPYLAEYFAMLYKYLIGIAGLLAGVMITIAGFEWLTAAGDAGKIKQAKSRITSALIGLILALGSYTVLFMINPDLVTFKSLKLPFVQHEDLEVDDDPDASLSDLAESAQQSIDSSAFATPGPGTCDAPSILGAGNYFVGLNTCNGADHCIWGVSMILRRAGCYQESTTPAGSAPIARFLKTKGWVVKNLAENPEGKRTQKDALVPFGNLLNDNEFVVARKLIPGSVHHWLVAKVSGVTYCIESGSRISVSQAQALGAPECYNANLSKIINDYKALGKTTAEISAKINQMCGTCSKIPNHGPGFDGIGRSYASSRSQRFVISKCTGRNASAILCPPNQPGPCTR